MSDTTKLIADARQAADALEEYEFEDHASEAAGLLNSLADALEAALPREVTWPTPEQSEADPRYEEATVDALEKVWRVEDTNPGTSWMSTETKVRLGIDFYNAACRILFAPSVTPGGEEQG